MDVLLVHGYNVTSTKTYGVLPKRLKSAGHKIKDVYLGKYVTLDNDITLEDLSKAFQSALTDIYGKKLNSASFACVTHSTGALVVRHWISHVLQTARNPLTHLIMLAPPTNGSRLAELGKSRLSRLRSLVGIEPGIKILNSLELGSRFQWDLNMDWIKNKRNQKAGFYPFVIIGQWIDKQLWDVIVPATYERGSDGVVRVSGANLNITKVTVNSKGDVAKSSMSNVPFYIPPSTSHSDSRFGIMGSVPTKGDHPVLDAILKCLDVKTKSDYQKCEKEFSEQTASLQETEGYYDKSKLDRYCQLVFRIVDDMGNALTDYAIEFLDKENAGDTLPSGFFVDRHKNDVNGEMMVYYLNYDKLSKIKDGRLGFRVTSVPNTPLIANDDVHYLDAAGKDSLMQPNQTTLIEVVLRRRINKNLFQLTKNMGEQKITGDPGKDWVE